MKQANRIANLPPYFFARLNGRIAELRKEGLDIIRLDIGSPDLPPPDFVLQELNRSAADPSHHSYAGYYGIPALRQAIADYYGRRFGVKLDPDTEVIPLIGSKEGIAHVPTAFVNAGDVVLVPDPGYPTYRMGVVLVEGKTYPVPLLPENDYLPDLEALPRSVLRRAAVLWLNYPNNPTGAVAPLAFFEQAINLARRHGLLICHDAPYADVAYDGYEPPSMLQVDGAREVVLEFNSLSKSHNMAGWRIGMAVGSAQAVKALALVKTNLDSGLFRPIQDAAIVALTGDQSWIAGRNAIYQERRDIVLAGLKQAGLRARRPKASLYLWPQVPAGLASADFAERLLEETGVSVTPGTAFGQHGEGHVRISVGQATERIREAMDRLVNFMAKGGHSST
ncbi:MAG: LL-diaminopimelate aminotransferase [Anaerolineae bacterium]|nr:MAG: LL-diaminopimelate aminotransferase [Anaerolineae bacterium]